MLTSHSMEQDEQVGPLDGFEFNKNKDGTMNKQIVMCTYYKKEFQFHQSCSSLKYHLNAKHALVGVSSATPGLRQTTLIEHRPVSKSNSDKLTNTIAKWVAKDCRPIPIVEDKGFANVLKVASLDTSYKPPCRGTIMSSSGICRPDGRPLDISE